MVAHLLSVLLLLLRLLLLCLPVLLVVLVARLLLLLALFPLSSTWMTRSLCALPCVVPVLPPLRVLWAVSPPLPLVPPPVRLLLLLPLLLLLLVVPAAGRDTSRR